MQKHLVWVPLLVLTAAVTAAADVQLPRVIGNNMVLQRNKPLPIWGWDEVAQKVTVTLGEASATATAGQNGKWLVTLPAQNAGGPHILSIRGSSKVKLKNVLIGEVWICSGQSNMSWPLHRCQPPDRKIVPGADLPQIRHIRLPTVMAAKPLGDDSAAVGLTHFGKQRGTKQAVLLPRPPDRNATAKHPGAGWQVCSPAAARSSFTAVAYFFARELHKELGVPIGVINSAWGGSKIEPWIPPSGFESVRELKETLDSLDKRLGGRIDFNVPTAIYNGMIHPLLPYAIRGTIWYQGESNGNEGDSYVHKKRALINGWRKEWKQGDFPFYFVQLPNYLSSNNDPQGGDGWARIREAQSKVPAHLKNTGMAITIDVGEAGNIHPANKYSVGRRLAIWALAKDYGKKNLVYSGPIYRSMKAVGGTIELTFDYVGSGLMAAKMSEFRSRESAKPVDKLDGLALAGAGTEMPKPVDKLAGFAIAGADRRWHWADAVIKGNKVIVSSVKVKRPVAVRYAFSANPVRANLYNKEGLPASPFRTDTWKFIRYRDHTLSAIVDERKSSP